MESTSLYNPASSAPKMERKYIEKNRRCQMKTLYFKLGSLLPRQHCKEGSALPDKIDEAVKYIQSLQLELEKLKDNKDKLMSRKREHSCITDDTMSPIKKSRSPHLEIQEMGPDMDMVLVNGYDSFINFNEIIHVLHQQGAEVVQASFSSTGNSVFHILHPKFAGPTWRYEATANISTRLNELIYGTSPSYLELESNLDIWDFEIIDF
ncbi:hypothetical protein DCAR_0625061 [Daucus carota subsp. sativus]|uniref:BHLH domain-containing protein n=1 Tax=Daucus carota subsp. sativus TaxID=79200 RepID=A0AAF0XFW9_DAUCS|nr:PREDICTED: transcription factor bHLH118-like [Daucus carota subsp. sativus]WOH05641.1 hypothetical protein DCAR_0625061 [Daucus carota subsp. sativus]